MSETRRPRGSTGVLLPVGEAQQGDSEDAGRAGFELCSPFQHPHQRALSTSYRTRSPVSRLPFNASSAKLHSLLAAQHKSASHHGGVSAARLPHTVMMSRQRAITASERRRITAGHFRPTFTPRFVDDRDTLWKHHPGEDKDDMSYPMRMKPKLKC